MGPCEVSLVAPHLDGVDGELSGLWEVEVELEEDEYYDLEAMSKKELEELGREYGIELDRRKNKEDLIEEVEAAIEKWNEENEE